MKHSKEPWANSGSISIVDADSRVILGVHAVADTEHEEHASNIRRAVACVNACQGISTESLELFADSVRAAIARCEAQS